MFQKKGIIMQDRFYDVAFIGAGQGGGRIAAAFYDRGYEKVLAVNTAPQDLNRLNIPDEKKIALPCERHGAGKDPSVAESLVKANSDSIKEKLKSEFGYCDRIIVCIGAGGGTGTGSCGPLVSIAVEYMRSIGFKDPNKKVGVICSMPTDGEYRSPAVARNAGLVIGRVRTLSRNKEISPAILIDNNKIRDIFPGLTMREFWPTANKSVAEAFDAFNAIPCLDSPFASFDPSDYEGVMESGGFMSMGVSKVEGEPNKENFIESFERSLKENIVCDTYSMKTSMASACIFSCSPEITESTPGLMDEIDDALDAMASRLQSEYIHRGVYESDDDGVKIYTIAGGLSLPEGLLQKLDRLSR